MNDDKEEDEDDTKADSWSVGMRNKRSGNKHDSNEVKNVRNTCELREIDTEENDEHKKDDDRHWKEKILQIKTPRATGGSCRRKLNKRCEKRKTNERKRGRRKMVPT